MKKNILAISSLTAAIAVVFLVVSCYKLDPRDNKFDPGAGSFYTGGSNSSDTTIRGWKIDTTVGTPSLGSLRCVNVPMGQKKKIHFTDVTSAGILPTGTWINIRTEGLSSGALTFSYVGTNGGGSASISGNLPINPEASFANVQLNNFSVNPTWGAVVTTHFYLEIVNNSDSDGSNTVWIDNLRVTNGTAGNHSVQFNSGFSIDGDVEQ